MVFRVGCVTGCIWLLVSWGQLPFSGILIWYMHIYPMCFQSWVYQRGIQLRVAFSAFIHFGVCLVFTVAVFGESKSSSFIGWVFLFLGIRLVLLLVASVVDKLLFACSVLCVTTWSSNFSAFAACFLQKLLPPSLFGILAIFVRGFSLSSLLAVGPIVFVQSPISVSCLFQYAASNTVNQQQFANEYMKDHLFELRRKIWFYDWSLQLHTQLEQLWNKSLNGIQTHDLCDTGAVL